jgi:hypothetical protein
MNTVILTKRKKVERWTKGTRKGKLEKNEEKIKKRILNWKKENEETKIERQKQIITVERKTRVIIVADCIVRNTRSLNLKSTLNLKATTLVNETAETVTLSYPSISCNTLSDPSMSVGEHQARQSDKARQTHYRPTHGQTCNLITSLQNQPAATLRTCQTEPFSNFKGPAKRKFQIKVCYTGKITAVRYEHLQRPYGFLHETMTF